ncbi:three-Cys-motif partner protein TcmP [Dyella japonica]|uniref:GMT-like wHTH domain-containing protein n=1 Tax=Dyella japonica A8 TaxID=1217721 RepID=A0A075K2N8_9GAMM|nr:three-Cys-motif partner protein TcmP [Dyella japonica]AIF48200.1 hypothetical protein HY57_13515 [Dyella japonica A8]
MGNKGYVWSLGGPLPVIDDHSLAKHEVLRSYLVNYLRILALSARSEGIRVTLVDGFAGGGRYRTSQGVEVGGSPLVLLHALREARAKIVLDRQARGIRTPYTIDAHIHLVERTPSSCAFLRKVIDESPEAHAPQTQVTVHQGDFHQTLPAILGDIRVRQRRTGRSVFILDQYGWSQVNLDSVRQIFAELPRAEVFLTWMIDNLVNFLSEKTVGALNPALQRIGLGDALTAEHLLTIKAADETGLGDLTWRRAIQSLMTDQIRLSSGATYSTPFYIVPRNSRRGYWLLHLARHLRANEEMKRIHWQNNNLHHPGGSGFNMLGYLGGNGQLTFDNRFDQHAQQVTLEALQEDIPQRLRSLRGPIRFGDLVQHTANETPACLAQLQEAVFTLARERQLMLTTQAGAARRTAHSVAEDDLIEVPPQLWLLPIRS